MCYVSVNIAKRNLYSFIVSDYRYLRHLAHRLLVLKGVIWHGLKHENKKLCTFPTRKVRMIFSRLYSTVRDAIGHIYQKYCRCTETIYQCQEFFTYYYLFKLLFIVSVKSSIPVT